jgi:predicted AlkP superfamily phosphohydrolase/phosphomutase
MRTLIFGLDGYDFEFATRLAHRGELPWLREQLRRGSTVETRCPTLPGSEWVNVACGVGAAQHGYFHPYQLRTGTYEIIEIDATVVRTEPFYVPLARVGIDTTVIDLPVDRPRPANNLTQVIDWGTEFKLYHYCTTPRATADFVKHAAGPHPLTDYGTTIPDEPTLIALRRKLLDGIAAKGRLTRTFMRANPAWRVLFSGFGEVHKGGHFFWAFQDPTHPDHCGAEHPLANALEELYIALDRELADVHAHAGPDVNMIIIADRGMGANHRGDHLVATLLNRWGLSDFEPKPLASEPQGADDVRRLTQTPVPLLRRFKRRVPPSLRPLLRRLGGFQRDWSGAKVFQVPEVGNSYLRVNLREREPGGTVNPGAEHDELLAALDAEFRALVNPATGQLAVTDVVYPRRAFRGPVNDWLPDLGVVWSPAARITALESPSIGRIDGAHWEQRSGNHTNVGAMLFAGPAFTAGCTRRGDLREFAPTLLALHGVPIPTHYECAPMAELRDAALLR